MSRRGAFADDDLEAIVDHPYVRKNKGNQEDRPGCAGPWALRQADSIMEADINRFLGYAYEEEGTPSDLRDLIGSYFRSRYRAAPPSTTLSNLEKFVHLAELLSFGYVLSPAERLARTPVNQKHGRVQ